MSQINQSGSSSGSEQNTLRHRVLFIIGELGYGGSERQLRLLLEHLDRNEWDARVLAYHPSKDGDYSAQIQQMGVEIDSPNPGGRGLIGKISATMSVARRFRPHLVHSWTVHDNPFAALAAKVGRANTSWGSLRGSMSLPGFRSLPGWYRTLALKSVQRIVVNSAALANELYTIGLDESRVLLVPNCVSCDGGGFKEIRMDDCSDFGFSRENTVVGNVGNIRRVKNQLLFVRAMAKVIENHPKARAVIVGGTMTGEDSTRAEIDREILLSGLDGKIVVAGFRKNVRQLLSGFSALCVTSDSEGTPNVVLEAMAANVPVVSTNVGGVPEIVKSGETGLLVEAGNLDGLVSALCTILRQPVESARLAKSAFQFVQKERDCLAMSRQLAEEYRGAILKRPKR